MKENKKEVISKTMKGGLMNCFLMVLVFTSLILRIDLARALRFSRKRSRQVCMKMVSVMMIFLMSSSIVFAATVSHPASQVTGDIFGAGDFTFPNDLSVDGDLTASDISALDISASDITASYITALNITALNITALGIICDSTGCIGEGSSLRDDCEADQIVQWDGDSWECADESGGVETDPTVLDWVKDGISWLELLGVPLNIDEDSTDDLTISTVFGGDVSGTYDNIQLEQSVVTGSEIDPTVPADIKDGISWDEVSGIPLNIDDDSTDDLTISTAFGGDVSGTYDNIQLDPNAVTSSEIDPTVPADIKDGISWDEVSDKPPELVDGDDVDDADADPTNEIQNLDDVVSQGSSTDVAVTLDADGDGVTTVGGEFSVGGGLTVGGGYGSSGITIESDGDILIDGDITQASGKSYISDETRYRGDFAVALTTKFGVGADGTDTDYLLISADGSISDNGAAVTINDDLRVAGLTNCDTIDTDSNGNLVCGTDSNDGGDITGVTAGMGLSGGGIDGDVTLNVGEGHGITVAADSVAVDETGLICTDIPGLSADLCDSSDAVDDADADPANEIQNLESVALQGSSTNEALTLDADGNEVTTVGGELTVGGDILVQGTGFNNPSISLPQAQQHIRLGDRGVIQSWPSEGLGGTRITHNIEHQGGIGDKRIVTAAASELLVGSGDVRFYTDGSGTAGEVFAPSERMRIDSSGNVGIGTAAPSEELQIGDSDTSDGGSQKALVITGNAAGSPEGGEIRLETAADYDDTYDSYRIDAYEDDLRIGRAGVGTDIILTDGGNVGIGTATPSEKLEVDGNVKASGTVCDSNGCIGDEGGPPGSFTQPGVLELAPQQITNDHTCAILSDKTVKCWGRNTQGQLGIGSTTSKSLPTAVSLPSDVAAIAQTRLSTFALLENGDVHSWGYNLGGIGQLGLGISTTVSITTPQKINGLSGITKIVTSEPGYSNVESVCALDSNGNVWCWGSNEHEQLGIGVNNGYRSTPTQVVGLSGVSDIDLSGGRYASACAIKSADGTVWCWGGNWRGQLGIGSMNPSGEQISTPTQTVGLTNIVKIVSTGAVGGNTMAHRCALDTNGKEWCWGYNGYGAVGDGTNINVNIPYNVMNNVESIAVGGGYYGSSYAILNNGDVYAWGYNGYGQLGKGVTGGTHYTPAQVSGLSDVKQIAVGGTGSYTPTCALLNNGDVKCMGYNGNYNLGLGVTGTRNSPTLVNIQNVDKIYVKGESTTARFCALLTDGKLKCWGYNNYGQIGDGTTTTARTPVYTKISDLAGIKTIVSGGGQNHPSTYALLSDGTVMAWGANNYGQLGKGVTGGTHYTPAQVIGLSGVTQIEVIGSGSYTTTCVLINDGTVKCMGYNGNGQVGDGTTATKNVPTTVVNLNNVYKLFGYGGDSSSNQGHFCALLNDGRMKCWGRNLYGIIGDGTTTNALVPTYVII